MWRLEILYGASTRGPVWRRLCGKLLIHEMTPIFMNELLFEKCRNSLQGRPRDFRIGLKDAESNFS